MVINDIHRHVVCEEVTCFSHYTFDVIIESLSRVDGKVAVFLHPMYKKLYPCSESHRYGCVDTEDGCVRFECKSCGRISYQGSDPYREGNTKLLESCQAHKNLYPFLYLTLSDNTMQQEMDYFEANYKSKFWGIKVHPNLCSKKMSEIHFTSNYPMIIHCGMSEYDNPKDIIKYAKRYPGKVILAHLARCEESVLEEIAKSENIFVDTSPTYLPFQIANKSTNRFYPTPITDVSNTTQLFRNLIDAIGDRKIIFGTDAPWGHEEEAVKIFHELDIPIEQKRNIFQSNFEYFISKK